LGSCNVLLGMFLWLKTLYRKRAVTWPFIFYTIIWTLSNVCVVCFKKERKIWLKKQSCLYVRLV
ncbi:hypothetical protein F6X82_02870, partial [Enterococcus faecium]